MTSPEQDKIIEALAAEHGAVKVLPLRGTDAVLACGWIEAFGPDGQDDSEPRGAWWYVPAAFNGDVFALRYAYDTEIADALKQDAVRELLSACGATLMPTGGRSRRDTANQTAAKVRSAERRKCPACGRKAAMVRAEPPALKAEWPGSVSAYCRWCGHERFRSAAGLRP